MREMLMDVEVDVNVEGLKRAVDFFIFLPASRPSVYTSTLCGGKDRTGSGNRKKSKKTEWTHLTLPGFSQRSRRVGLPTPHFRRAQLSGVGFPEIFPRCTRITPKWLPSSPGQ
jgi:hypothetical protein